MVEKQPHAAGTTRSRRSQSAAKAKHARISSAVKSGKSASTSSGVMPQAAIARLLHCVVRSALATPMDRGSQT